MAENDVSIIIRAREAFKASFDSLNRELQKLETQTGKTGAAAKAGMPYFSPGGGLDAGFKETATSAGLLTRGLGLLAGAFSVHAIAGWVQDALAFGSQLRNLSTQTRIGVGDLQVFRAAGRDVGVELNDIASAANLLSDRLGGRERGAVFAVGALGLSMEKLIAAGPARALIEVAQAADRIEDPTMRANLAKDLFGRNWAAILNVAKSYDEVKKSVETMSSGQIDALAKAESAWSRWVDFLKIQVHKAVAGEIQNLSGLERALGQWRASLSGENVVNLTRPTAMVQGFSDSLERLARANHAATEAGQQHAAATTASLSPTTMLQNALKDLRSQALEPLSALQREYIRELKLRGGSEAEATSRTGGAAAAVHAYWQQLDKAAQATKQAAKAAQEHQQSLQKLQQTLKEVAFDLDVALIKFNSEHLTAGKRKVDAFAEAWVSYQQGVRLAGEQTRKVFDDILDEALDDNKKKVADWAGEWLESQALIDGSLKTLAAGFAQLSQIAGGSLGNIAGWIGNVIGAIDLGTQAADDLQKGWAKLEDEGAGFGEKVAFATANILSMVAAMDQATATGNTLMKTLGGAATGAQIGGALGGGIGAGIGAAIGGAIGFFRGIFGDSEQEKRNKQATRDLYDLYVSFVRAQGGAAKLAITSALIGDTVSMAGLKGQAGLQTLQREIDEFTRKQNLLQSAMEEFGFTWEDLGPKARQAKLTELGDELLGKYTALVAAGIDVTKVNEKMATSVNAFIASALRTGTEVPESMRPMIDKMIEMGLLTDENGEKITGLEGSGIKFAKTFTEGVGDMVKAIRELPGEMVRAFRGGIDGALGELGRLPGRISIPIDFPTEGLPHVPGGGGGVPHAQHGLAGFFGQHGGLVRMHGLEAAIPLDRPATGVPDWVFERIGSLNRPNTGGPIVVHLNTHLDGRVVARQIVPLIPDTLGEYGLRG